MSLLRMIIRALFGRKSRRRPAFRQNQWSASRTPIVPVPLQPIQKVLQGECWVIDGDTIVIEKIHIRIAGIDAPELDHPFGKQAKWALRQLCRGQIVTAHVRPELSYDRLVAECFLPDGRDIAAELVKAGLALDWRKFSGGKYRHFEPENSRRKLWRVDARQRGKLRPKPIDPLGD